MNSVVLTYNNMTERMANSKIYCIDPDQTAGAVWSGSTLAKNHEWGHGLLDLEPACDKGLLLLNVIFFYIRQFVCLYTVLVLIKVGEAVQLTKMLNGNHSQTSKSSEVIIPILFIVVGTGLAWIVLFICSVNQTLNQSDHLPHVYKFEPYLLLALYYIIVC